MPWAVRHDRGAAANITLTRPDRLNAFTGEDILGLKDSLEEISRRFNHPGGGAQGGRPCLLRWGRLARHA